MSLTVVGPDEGERAGGRARILHDSERITVVEFDYPELREGPERHVHHHHGDGFHVVEGELAFLLGPGPAEVIGGPGTTAFSPPDVAHTFRNNIEAHSRFINIHVPGCGFGDYMLGRKDDFDQHPPPADGGRPLSEAIVRRGERVEHELIAIDVVRVASGWSASGCFYVLAGSNELPERTFASGLLELPDDAHPVTLLHLEPR